MWQVNPRCDGLLSRRCREREATVGGSNPVKDLATFSLDRGVCGPSRSLL